MTLIIPLAWCLFCMMSGFGATRSELLFSLLPDLSIPIWAFIGGGVLLFDLNLFLVTLAIRGLEQDRNETNLDNIESAKLGDRNRIISIVLIVICFSMLPSAMFVL